MLKWFAFLLVALCLMACGDENLTSRPVEVEEQPLFGNYDKLEIDSKNMEIKLTDDKDSLQIVSLDVLGSGSFYLALDGDLEDPEIDWDNPLDSGAILVKENGAFKNIVVLDGSNRVHAVWQIVLPEEWSSSSEEDDDDSLSSSEDSAESSSSEIAESSSSEESGSSSSVDKTVVSSSSEEKSSSSKEKGEDSSSSSEVSAESSSSELELESSSSEQSVSSSSVDKADVSSSSEKTSSSSKEKGDDSSSSSEVSAGSSSSELAESSSSEKPASSSSVELESSSSEELDEPVESSNSADEPQLPGSDFSERVDSFWGTTSDAMENDVWNSLIHLSSSKNLETDGSTITLTSRIVSGSGVGKKLLSGFYFAGSFDGVDCDALYNADGGYPGLESSNITNRMNFGRPFTGRPEAFQVKYAYEHVDGGDAGHPQLGLIYVMLVSRDNKIVASGMITDDASVPLTTKTVALNYGEAPEELIDGKFAVQPGLALGDGSEDVAYIHVMFASSAHGHVGSTSYRGGVDSKLIIDDFKLVY